MAIDTPTITVTDNGDDTGATVAIAGSTAGTTNTFRAGLVVGGQLTILADIDSRVGDGSIDATLDAGHYFGLVTSSLLSDTADSNVVSFSVTATGTELQMRMLQEVANRIVGLSLTGIDADHVRVDILPITLNVTYPAIFVSLDGCTETSQKATNRRDDVTYEVSVAIAHKASIEDVTTRMPQALGWRRSIRQSFRNQGIPNIAEVFRCNVRHLPIVPKETKEFLLFITSLIIELTVRE